jgi:hypothetical protein
MKHGIMYAFGFITAALLALGAGSAAADATGPYYATPSWDQQLPASTRFVVLSNWGSAAVLDRETGLIWERSPSTSTTYWQSAELHCNQLITGGRLGWRLPTLQELASLVDPIVAFPGPTLPAGHPFLTVQSSGYFSATTYAFNASLAWGIEFAGGSVGNAFDKGSNYFVWCVRGGQGVDPQ